MALLLNAQGLTVQYGAEPLFENVSLAISEGDRLGLIGPNGSGKSTLLEILAGRRASDTGEVALRKGVKLAYVAQVSEFAPGETARTAIVRAAQAAPEGERDRRVGETLGRAGFTDFDVAASTLSGGWRKRLAIAEALAAAPDVLLLDEPTNHLDLAGIEWLERLLREASFACIVVSHDRYFLQNAATAVAELQRIYPHGMLRVEGDYAAYLEKRAEWLAAQAKRQESLENRVRNELAWLRRGPKARTTKAKARIDQAHQLIGELREMNGRKQGSTAGIEFAASGRATKRLVQCTSVRFDYGTETIVRDLNLVLTAGTRIGLAGPNGSGKTTVLRLLTGALHPASGIVERAENLNVVAFEQERVLDERLTLRRALAPDSDSILYAGRVLHVASWAARFLFTADQLEQPVSKLSGGERARVLIAGLMRQQADVLLLDEPTNDLDIQTLEILEENLLEFPGALVLVTHDRFLLDRVATTVIGLDGRGESAQFADYRQWESWLTEQQRNASPSRQAQEMNEKRQPPVSVARGKKLSYLDARDRETIEERIRLADELLTKKRAALEDAAVVRDSDRLRQAVLAIEEAEGEAEALYQRWVELEEKLAHG